MRIHTNTLTSSDIFKACQAANVYSETEARHGSRSHDHAFEIILSGNSTRNAMGKDFKAATWDQWGVFLGILFDIDPSMSAGGKTTYPDAATFHDKTFNRFTSVGRQNIDVKSSHQHRWIYSGTPFLSECKSEDCEAQVQWCYE